MSIQVGSDTYGRVKTVAGTPIVTQFFMLQAFPLVPLKSFYFRGHGNTVKEGVPFVASNTTTEVRGVPLARLDRTSVAIAYLRGLCGLFLIVGFMGTLVPGILYLSGERLDEFARILFALCASLLATGTLVGVLSYGLPLMTRRERAIRSYCRELLGIAIDPARVTAEVCEADERFVVESYGGHPSPRVQLLSELVIVRAHLGQGHQAQPLEQQTDDLLDRLRLADLLEGKR